jgi:hypothetical protein
LSTFVRHARYAIAVLAAAGGFGVALALSGAQAGAASSAADDITGGQTLTSGSTLETADGHYEAIFTNGVLSDQIVGGRTLWSVGSSDPGAYAVLQPNGMLVIFAPTGQVNWDSGVTGSGCPTLEMQLDGNLGDYDPAQIWTAGSAQHGMQGGDELLPGWSLYPSGAAYRLEMETSGDLALENDSGTAIWTSDTKSAGAYAAFQTDGNLVVYSSAKKALWSTKTSGNKGSTLALGSDGNIVISSSAGKQLWDSDSTGKAGTGKSFAVAPVPASATPCPGDVTVPTTTVVQTQTETQTQTVVNTQTVVVPTTTVVTVAVPTPTHRRVDVRMTVRFGFKGARTFLDQIAIGKLPKGTELSSTYNPHLRRHKASVRRATTARGVRRMITELRRIVYRPRQTLNLDLTHHGYENEWATFTFRADKLPNVRPVISRR